MVFLRTKFVVSQNEMESKNINKLRVDQQNVTLFEKVGSFFLYFFRSAFIPVTCGGLSEISSWARFSQRAIVWQPLNCNVQKAKTQP